MGKGMRAGKKPKAAGGNMQAQMAQVQAMQRKMQETQEKILSVDPAELLTRDGKDGKRYHFQPKQHAERNPVRCLLHSITRKLDALDMAADECGITPEDTAQLNKIGCRLFDTAEAWRTAFDGSTGKGGKE